MFLSQIKGFDQSLNCLVSVSIIYSFNGRESSGSDAFDVFTVLIVDSCFEPLILLSRSALHSNSVSFDDYTSQIPLLGDQSRFTPVQFR